MTFRPRDMKVFINCATGLGNIILFLPAFRAFRQRYPLARCTVALDSRFYGDPFFQRQFGDGTAFVRLDYPRRGLGAFLSAMVALRAQRFDLALGPFCGASWRMGLLLLLVGAAKTAYFRTRHRLLDSLFPILCDPREGDHYVHRNYGQLKPFGIECEVPGQWVFPEEERAAALRAKKADRVWVAVHAGGNVGFNTARLWPKERYRDLVDILKGDGRIDVVLFGHGEKERAMNDFVGARLPERRRIAVEDRPLGEVAAYISCCDVFVGNDSGLMNLSVALNVPTLGVLGPTDPRHTGPLGPSGRVVCLDLPCMPCFDSGFSLRCPHRRCLTGLGADAVLAGVREVLEDRGERTRGGFLRCASSPKN